MDEQVCIEVLEKLIKENEAFDYLIPIVLQKGIDAIKELSDLKAELQAEKEDNFDLRTDKSILRQAIEEAIELITERYDEDAAVETLKNAL
ncbi:hypothetical protein AAGS61_08635 [Lysinibacillus sp. KU-BSD001]|uniref:hypothetical protein n=1 Tax=Lysinibacillus sp. KU-BSD001 TaxID=3141328 RepID=UPI0036E32B79